MTRTSTGIGSVVLVCAAALAGCAETGPGTATERLTAVGGVTLEAPAAAVAAEPAFDLSGALERARTAFFHDEGALVAGSGTHRVRIVEGQDSVELWPIHHTAAAEARTLDVGGSRPRTSPVPEGQGRLEAASPLRVRTESVTRSGWWPDTTATNVRTADGAVSIDRGAVVEELENAEDGLEQRWLFARAPEGGGDLVIRVAVSGMEHVGTTGTGAHFADAATGLGVRYGHGTWIDAGGERVAVPVTFEAGALVLRVPGRVVDQARYPAVLDPVIGPEIAIDTPVTGARGANQVQAQLASNGTDAYLLVFVDRLFGDDDVRGVRLGPDGTLLDATSFRIATAVGTNQTAPDVAWNGTAWVVVWQDGRSAVDWDVYGTTVSATGAVAMEEGVAISATASTDEREPTIAAAGATSLVVFRSGDDTSSDVLGTRLNAAGTPTDAVPFVVGGGAGVQSEPAVVATATEFLVTFTDDPDGAGTASNPNIRGRRARASGAALIDAAPFSITTTVGFGSQPGWAGGTSYLAVWTGVRAGFYTINASPIPTAGAVAPAPIEVSPGAATRDYMNADVAWNGSAYLVGYTDAFYDTAMMRFTSYTIGARALTAAGATSGAAIDPTSIALDTADVTVAAIGSAFYLAYTDASGESADIRGTRITGTSVSTPAGQLLSSGPNDETAPVLTGSGTGWLVAWLDFRGSQMDAWAATLGPTGTVSGGPMLLAGGAGAQRPTDAAWSGSRYVVAYSDVQDVRGVTVTAAGIASAPFPIATSATLAEGEASIACGPAALQCLVAWTEYDAAAMPIDPSVRAARLDASSASVTVGAAATVVAAAGDQFDPDVTAATTQFYVTWTDGRVPTNVDVRGTRFLATALEAGGTVVGGAAGAQYGPAVGSNGTDFVVTFIDERSGGTRPMDVYAALVLGGTGALSGTAAAVASTADDETDPTIAWNGTRFLVAYTRVSDTVTALEARRLSPAGALVDATALAITDVAVHSDQPILAGGSMGEWLLAYRVFSGGAARTRARLIRDDLVVGATCAAATECASGFCVDGVCCMTACAGGTTDCNACSIAAGATVDGTCGPIAACADAGPPDAGPVDGGGVTTDGGDVDGGGVTTDGGTTADGGTGTDGGGPGTDGGGTDGGGTGTDGGGPRPDAGSTPPPPASSGCSCSVPPTGAMPPAGLGLVLALGVLGALRRRSSARRSR